MWMIALNKFQAPGCEVNTSTIIYLTSHLRCNIFNLPKMNMITSRRMAAIMAKASLVIGL